METLKDLAAKFLHRPPVSKARTEREDLIEQFRERLNLERIGTKYKPLSFMAVKMKVHHLSDHDLKYLWSICKDSKGGFSKCFFGSLKAKK